MSPLTSIHYFSEIWNTDQFPSYKMSFSSYTEPATATTVESGSFVGYRTKHREWADDEARLVAIKSHNSIRSDGWDPEDGYTHDWMANQIFYW